MLPTPSTSHIPPSVPVYPPSEDSFLLLDTLSSPSQRAYLGARFSHVHSHSHTPKTAPTPQSPPPPPLPTPPPLILDLGTGSGLILAFLAAHAQAIFSRPDILTLAVDLNPHACRAAVQTVQRELVATATAKAAAEAEAKTAEARRAGEEEETGREKRGGSGSGTHGFLGAVQADLLAALRPGSVDVLVFNPPYVPTDSLPDAVSSLSLSSSEAAAAVGVGVPEARNADDARETRFRAESHFLELAYAGGADGMEVTSRFLGQVRDVLSARGVCYLLLCARNRPEGVLEVVRRGWNAEEGKGGDSGDGGNGEGKKWRAEIVGRSGKKAGWESLCVVRIAREEGGE